jgi:L-alanine-DL-glutamate epimerase-like enolase superfamily enzyme
VKFHFEHIDLRLRHTFTIARSSRDVEPTLVVNIEHDGIVGYGEASPSERYGETPATVGAFFGRLDLSQFRDPFALDEILDYVSKASQGDSAAKAAIDIALHDWVGKKLAVPLWKLWGCNPGKAPVTSFTIGLDSPDKMLEKVLEADRFPILKVKVGVPHDRDIIDFLRRNTTKKIRVDANEGWKRKEEALETILWLEEQGIEFVEQPLPANQLDDIAWLRKRVHIPLIADESVTMAADIPRLNEAFDGINIKLMKCTGLREALRMINTARALSMKVMLGCMIESSIGISAAAQLSPLVDYADLDGNLLITNDPFEGVTVSDGRLELGNSPGIGARKRA